MVLSQEACSGPHNGSAMLRPLVIIGGLFVLAGLCEIGGGYLVGRWIREHKPLLWALLGAVILAAYGVVAALQPISEFRRVYAAYGGVFIAGVAVRDHR